MPSARQLSILIVLFASAAPLTPGLASGGGGPRPNLPRTIAVADGVVIAHGNELEAPLILAIENDALCIYDGTGRRFVSPPLGDSASLTHSELPTPRLLVPPARSIPPNAAGAGQASECEVLSLRMSQLAYVLSRGGLLAFGRSYALVLAPASAATALPQLRWVIDHPLLFSDRTVDGDPLLRDLKWPAPLPPIPVETRSEDGSEPPDRIGELGLPELPTGRTGPA